MTDNDIKLTFAELECLLGAEPDWPEVRKMLGFPESDLDAFKRAGVASLIARGYAEMRDGQLVGSEALVQLAHRLVDTKTAVSLVTVHEHDVGVALFLEAPAGERTVVSLFAKDVMSLVPFVNDMSCTDQIMGLVDAAMAVDGALTVAVPAMPPLVVQRQDGVWSTADVVPGAAGPNFKEMSQGEAMAQIRQLLDSVAW